MSSVFNSDFQSSVPLVQLDVQLDSSVEQSSRKKDRLCLGVFLAVESKSGVSTRLRRQFLDVVDELHFVGFIDGRESDFNSIEFSTVDTHSSEACPECVLLDESTHSDSLFEISLVNVLVEHLWIWRYSKGC